MSGPTASDQIQFLTNLQRLLSEGVFTATYKYALLLSLADLAVETTGEAESTLVVDTRTLAEKFIQYYWRQTLPYSTQTRPEGKILLQNTNPQKDVAIFSVVNQLRLLSNGSLTRAVAN